MARTTSRPKASGEKAFRTRRRQCPSCRKTMWSAYVSHRTVTTLQGVDGIALHVRRCRNPSCARYHKPFRPEMEGRVALPQHEFGLDVIALVDAYDAITSRRRYKEAIDHDQAVDMICADAGTHFDPALIDPFRRCADRFSRIRQAYCDLLAEPELIAT